MRRVVKGHCKWHGLKSARSARVRIMIRVGIRVRVFMVRVSSGLQLAGYRPWAQKIHSIFNI